MSAQKALLMCCCDTSWITRLTHPEITQAHHFVQLPDLLMACEMQACK